MGSRAMRELYSSYPRLGVDEIFRPWQTHVTGADRKRFTKVVAKAKHEDSLRALTRVTTAPSIRNRERQG